MANYVGIWKYDNLNYFDVDLDTCIDKIQIDYLPLSSFPVFDLITEDINSVGVYKAGDFAVSLLTTGGERSVTLSESVSTFFRGGTRNYKFLIGIQFGTQKFWGTFTNADVEYDYKTKRLDIRAGALDYELKEILDLNLVGTMNVNKNVEDFLQQDLIGGVIPSNKLICYAPFVYSTLIGGSLGEYKIRWELQANGGWVGSMTVWEQMTDLLLGTGLRFFIYTEYSPNVNSTNFPQFVLKITYLDAFTASTTTPIIFDAQEKTTYNNQNGIFLKYWTWSHQSSDICYGAFSYLDENGGLNTLTGDIVNPSHDVFPYFFIGDDGPSSDTKPNTLNYLTSFNDIQYFPLSDVNMIEPTLFAHELEGVFGADNKVSLPRIINNGSHIYGEEYGSPLKVYRYAIRQFERYLGNVKRQKVLKVKFDDTTDYDLYKTIQLLDDEQRQRTYYIAEMRNLDFAKKRVELTCVEV